MEKKEILLRARYFSEFLAAIFEVVQDHAGISKYASGSDPMYDADAGVK